MFSVEKKQIRMVHVGDDTLSSFRAGLSYCVAVADLRAIPVSSYRMLLFFDFVRNLRWPDRPDRTMLIQNSKRFTVYLGDASYRSSAGSVSIVRYRVGYENLL